MLGLRQTTGDITKPTPVRVRKRVLTMMVAPLLAIAAVLAAAPSAATEGRFEFKIEYEYAGWASDYWYDSGNDNALTEARLQECNSNPQIGLQHWNGSTWTTYPWQPIYYCLGTDGGWKNWGTNANLVTGYFRLIVLNTRSDGNPLYARFVTVKY